MTERIAVLGNIPSPYNVDLNIALQNGIPDYEFYFIYTSSNEGNRKWKTDISQLNHVEILDSKVIPLKTKNDVRFIHLPPNLQKILEKINPVIVIGKEYNPSAISSLLWCRKNHRKYIHVTEGTLVNERHLNAFQKLSRRFIISNADFCIAASTKAKEKLLFWKCPEEKIAVAYLTFDWQKMKENKRTPVKGRILYVGSMAERKGVDLLIKSLSYLRTPWDLHIVGNGDEQEIQNLKAMAGKLGLHNCITWCGYLEGEDLYKEYAEASIFVLPTREDCFGLVLLEAAAQGVPIVSSKYADGAYDVIREGITGFIEDPFDSQVFARAIETVLTDAMYSENAKTQDLSRFDITKVTEIYSDVLKKMTE